MTNILILIVLLVLFSDAVVQGSYNVSICHTNQTDIESIDDTKTSITRKICGENFCYELEDVTMVGMMEQNYEGFPPALNQFPNFKIFSVLNSKTFTLSQYEFKDTTIKKFVAKKNYCPVIEDHVFSGSEHLESIDMDENSIKEISQTAFKEAVNLKSISLFQNEIEILLPGTFDCPKLENLYLDSNKIKEVPDFFFSNAPNLIYLTLSNNTINEIRKETFQGLHNLEILKISSNNISTILPDTFEDLLNLKNITLKRNFIKIIHNGTFALNKKLIKINLSSNKIGAVSKLAFDSDQLGFVDLEENLCYIATPTNESELTDCFLAYDQMFSAENDTKANISTQLSGTENVTKANIVTQPNGAENVTKSNVTQPNGDQIVIEDGKTNYLMVGGCLIGFLIIVTAIIVICVCKKGRAQENIEQPEKAELNCNVDASAKIQNEVIGEVAEEHYEERDEKLQV